MSFGGALPPIVLIHGLWLTPRSWERWVERFEGRGLEVHAPAWPRMPGEVEEIRRDPSPLNGLGLTEIVDRYSEFVRALDQPPIVIGHSFGGLVTELVLDRGFGAAGVALAVVWWSIHRDPSEVPLTPGELRYLTEGDENATSRRPSFGANFST